MASTVDPTDLRGMRSLPVQTPGSMIDAKSTEAAVARLRARLDAANQMPQYQPTLLSGWVNYDESIYQGFRARKVNGLVVVEGLLKSTSASQPITVLPPGYRPDKQLVFPVMTFSGLQRADVAANGTISVSGANHVYASMNGIIFAPA